MAESVIGVNWVSFDSQTPKPPSTTKVKPTSAAPNQLVEAQGWIFMPDGRVILTAEAPNTTSPNIWQAPIATEQCSDQQ